jgi:hypothetical protein
MRRPAAVDMKKYPRRLTSREGADIGIEDMSVIRIRGRVVDQDVDTAVGRVDRVEQAFDLIELADVAALCFRTAAHGRDRVDGLVAALGVTAAGNDMRAVFPEYLGDLGADTPAGTGDDGDLATEVEVIPRHPNSPVRCRLKGHAAAGLKVRRHGP